MAEEYYVKFRGRTVGPYEVWQLQQMARKGRLSRTTEISSDGANWNPAQSCPEIFQKPRAGDLAASSGLDDLGSSQSPDSLEGFYSEASSPSSPQTTAISASQQWYYTQGGAQLGPVPQATIATLLSSGQLSSSEHVWRDGLPSWVPIDQVDAFRTAIPAPVVTINQPTQPGYPAGGAGGGFCARCGTQTMPSAFACHQCGTPVNGQAQHAHGGTDRISASNPPKDPALAAILSGCCIWGLGQMYVGQVTKGIVILVGSMILISITLGFAILIVAPVTAIDAYNIAKKLKDGKTVGQWEWF